MAFQASLTRVPPPGSGSSSFRHFVNRTWRRGGSVTPTACDGFPTRAELRQRYAARSGRDVSELDFYVSFGYWKLACILEGVYSRYAAGAGGGDRGGFEGFGDQVARLGEASKEAAARL